MEVFDDGACLPVGDDGVEEQNEFGSAVVGVVFGLDLVEVDGVVRKGPIDLGCFEELVEDGVDGLLAGHAVGKQFVFESPDFGDQPEDFLLPFALVFCFSLHIFIIESIIQVD